MISSPEMFINMKRIPDATSKDYKAFIAYEKKKVKQGVTINGTLIPGWLYWHINHWTIDIDTQHAAGYLERKTQKPDLRDNEWMIGEAIHGAEVNKNGLLILGSRQLGKSEFGASYVGRRSVAFKNTQNIVAGLSTPDLTLLTSKIDRGFINLHPMFRPTKISNNWNKEVVLGYKDKAGERYKFSEILIRNLDGGDNTENLAGPTTSSLLLDEVGKGDFLEALIAAMPALQTPFGWRCSPIFTGTSGSFEKSNDLQKFFKALDTYNFKTINLLDHDGKLIHFIPGTRASRADRKTVRLSTYLKKAKGTEMDEIAIKVVRDEQEEIRKIKGQILAYQLIREFTLAKKEQMYYPIVLDDLFLTIDTDNPFTDIKDLAKEQLAYLEGMPNTEKYGFLERDSATGKPKFISTNKVPVEEFPTGEHEDKDAPIIFYDDPLDGAEFGILHVAGSDPYNQDESFYSPSLGTVYIFRRTYDPINGKFQESIVASYSARPKSIARWQEQVRLLLEYYQATILPENEEASFIRYFDEKNLGHYIEDGLDLAKEINPKTEVKRKKGLAATVPNIRYGNGMIRNYCLEDLVVGLDPAGEPIIKKGIIRIRDRALLKEIIEYVPKMNVDRIVAFRHALILANSKMKFHPTSKLKVAPPPDRVPRKIVRHPFAIPKTSTGRSVRGHNPFTRRRM